MINGQATIQLGGAVDACGTIPSGPSTIVSGLIDGTKMPTKITIDSVADSSGRCSVVLELVENVPQPGTIPPCSRTLRYLLKVPGIPAS